MTTRTEGPTDQDTFNLWALLLGGVAVDNGRDPGVDDIPPFNPGVLRRLLANFGGDPIAHRTTLNAPAAATFLTVPDRANSALVSVEVQPVRASFAGDVPTAAVGLLLPVGTLLQLTGRATLTGAQFIQTAAGAIVTAEYFT